MYIIIYTPKVKKILNGWFSKELYFSHSTSWYSLFEVLGVSVWKFGATGLLTFLCDLEIDGFLGIVAITVLEESSPLTASFLFLLLGGRPAFFFSFNCCNFIIFFSGDISDSVLPDFSSRHNYFFGEDLVLGAWLYSIVWDGTILPFLALDFLILI